MRFIISVRLIDMLSAVRVLPVNEGNFVHVYETKFLMLMSVVVFLQDSVHEIYSEV